MGRPSVDGRAEKRCYKCNETKPTSEFCNSKSRPDGLNSECRECCKLKKKANRHPLYETWRGIKRRCLNPSVAGYKRYGALGVNICDRWKRSFLLFLEDVGERPSQSHSLDRYPNPCGNYEPGNVRWATAEEQANNKRAFSRDPISDSDVCSMYASGMSMIEIAGSLGCSITPVKTRLERNGVEVSHQNTHKNKPRGARNHKAKLAEHQVREILSLRGKIGSRAIAKRFNVSRSAIQFILHGKNWAHLESPCTTEISGESE